LKKRGVLRERRCRLRTSLFKPKTQERIVGMAGFDDGFKEKTFTFKISGLGENQAGGGGGKGGEGSDQAWIKRPPLRGEKEEKGG